MLSAVNSMVNALDDKPWQHSLFAMPLSLAYLSQPADVCMDIKKGFESKPLSSFKQTARCPSSCALLSAAEGVCMGYMPASRGRHLLAVDGQEGLHIIYCLAVMIVAGTMMASR